MVDDLDAVEQGPQIGLVEVFLQQREADAGGQARKVRLLDLAVHLNTKLNRSHLLIGKESIILPVLGRTERDIRANRINIDTGAYASSILTALILEGSELRFLATDGGVARRP